MLRMLMPLSPRTRFEDLTVFLSLCVLPHLCRSVVRLRTLAGAASCSGQTRRIFAHRLPRTGRRDANIKKEAAPSSFCPIFPAPSAKRRCAVKVLRRARLCACRQSSFSSKRMLPRPCFLTTRRKMFLKKRYFRLNFLLSFRPAFFKFAVIRVIQITDRVIGPRPILCPRLAQFFHGLVSVPIFHVVKELLLVRIARFAVRRRDALFSSKPDPTSFMSTITTFRRIEKPKNEQSIA